MIKLLVADDDAVSRKMVEKSALSLKLKVSSAADGNAARDIIERVPINIAILDWMMPGITGIDLSREIRKRKSKEYQYILLLTARNHSEDIIRGLSAGADDYITKPFNLKELEARLKIGKRIINLQRNLLLTQKKLQAIAVHDDLTGLYNRREILRNLEEKFIQAQRETHPLGIIMLDIDHFKQINDRHGHQIGDTVLAEVGRRLKKGLRPYDKVGRYGGEEFLIILPKCGPKATKIIAERVRRNLGDEKIKTGNGDLRVTISLGCAITDPQEVTTVEKLLYRSDMALYHAKAQGRNRVSVKENE